MSAIDFPNSPSVNDEFTVGNRTWTWNGTVWELLTSSPTVISKNIINAKGDLIVGTADDTVARVGVGANGYVLAADSSTASGVTWLASDEDRDRIISTAVFI
jgi:hypothetical protein